MQAIQELLNRIRWDPEFGKGEFELEFADRFQAKPVRLSFCELIFPPTDHYFFHYRNAGGEQHSVPFHRIRAVYKNGDCIWRRGG